VKDAIKVAGVVAVAAALAWGFVSVEGRKGYGLRKGDLAPPLRLPTLDGGVVDLASFRGKLVVLNFWATWCPPCVEEMPSLEKLHRALGPVGLVVIGVSVDENEETLRAFLQKVGVTFPTLRDPGGRGPTAAYNTTGYPETFVVDPQGMLVDKYIGPAEWATPAAIDHFRELLGRLVSGRPEIAVLELRPRVFSSRTKAPPPKPPVQWAWPACHGRLELSPPSGCDSKSHPEVTNVLDISPAHRGRDLPARPRSLYRWADAARAITA
jgi:cytochrome c biogenesis protein CcmG, thiol:disulfide interchange protein DsbE